MKRIKQCLFGLVAAVWLALGSASAQPTGSNTIESLNVVQQGSVLNVKLTFKEPLPALPAAFSVAQPARIAFDFPNTTNGLGKSSQAYNEGDLKSANIVQVDDRTRVVLNLNKAMTYEATIDGNSLLLALIPSATPEGTLPVEHFARARPSELANSIRDVTFRRGKEGEGRITVDLTDPNAGIDIRQEGRNLVVDFVRVTVPETLRKRLDVTDFATPVLAVSTVQKGANARMTITPRGLWEHNAYQTDTQFVIEVKPIVEDPNKLVQGTRGGYQGEKLSLNFQNVDVRRLLQVIGEFTGMNMVVSDSVSGAITLILKDVPWDQALDIIMQQKDLAMRKHGNVILIAPREEIATKEKLEYESQVQIGDLEPLRTETFQINYIKAEDVRALLIGDSAGGGANGGGAKRSILSKRASATVEARSNILFVQDTASRLEEVRAIIAKVDVAARQVMIEARIVEASDSFAKDLGIRLGWRQKNYDGAYRIGGDDTAVRGNLDMGAQVNFPATPQSGTASTLSFILFNSALTRFLTTEISALEADGRGRVISSPRVMTSNQVEATIEQGQEIPYQTTEVTQGTTQSTTTFKEALLSLKVTPQITPDGKVSMELEVTKNSPNLFLPTGAGLAIDKRRVKTDVLVENGGTVVIGGIYTEQTRNNVERVPFFGDLPYVGWLFKRRQVIDEKTELLVFITPRIVAENLAVR